jgi:cobalt-zinc-cadmium efflux system outer membrane protein
MLLLGLVQLLCAAPGLAAASQGAAFMPSADLDLSGLIQAVRDRSPSLQQDHLAVEVSRAEALQSRLLDNPVLDAAVGTIPLGEPNPPELPQPLRNIPNYSVGLSVHPDLGRRGPRMDRAAHAVEAAEAQRRFSLRGRALLLLRTLGDLATATLRLAADQRLTVQARASLALARDRVRTGFGPPLDADRAEIELLRLEQQVAADQGEILVAQAACAEHVGIPCEPFATDGEARRFLAIWLARAEQVPAAIEHRPDLALLAAQHAAALAEDRLARAQLIPDPTVRLGYVYDSFVVSGNQRHSLGVLLSLPLPLVDRGQAASQAAQARAHRFAEQHRLTLIAAQARAASLRRALAAQRQRLVTLQEQVVPRGQAILRDVRRAFEARAVPLTDLNQAQRALDELLLQEATTLGDIFRLSVDLIEQGAGDD